MAFTDEEKKGMTIEEVQQEYFDRSEKANEVGNQVVWMLLIVMAALFVSGGATHRMRDFYASAMQKFIGNTKSLLRSYAEPEPF